MKWILIPFFLICAACGRHDSESFNLKIEGEVRKIEKPTEPLALMLQAVQNADRDGMEKLLGEGLRVDDLLPSGKTALIEAVIWNHAEVVRWLLEKGADKDIKDRDGRSALDHASGKEPILRLLKPEDFSQEVTELFAAVREARFNDVKKLLTAGLDPNVFEKGETPLILAIKLSRTPKFENVVRVFLQPGTKTDLRMRNAVGESPMSVALDLGLKRIVTMLKSRGVSEEEAGTARR